MCYFLSIAGVGKSDSEHLKDFDTASPLAGLGYGLPIARYLPVHAHHCTSMISVYLFTNGASRYMPQAIYLTFEFNFFV